MDEIQRLKDLLRGEYQDNGLLLCRPDGRPFDPDVVSKGFGKRQIDVGIPPEDRIVLQGLRKSGQMHKIRISNNNYQLVAASGGHSPEVLMQNYDEALDHEKRMLAQRVEASFYGKSEPSDGVTDMSAMVKALQANLELARKLMQSCRTIHSLHESAQQGKRFVPLQTFLAEIFRDV